MSKTSVSLSGFAVTLVFVGCAWKEEALIETRPSSVSELAGIWESMGGFMSDCMSIDTSGQVEFHTGGCLGEDTFRRTATCQGGKVVLDEPVKPYARSKVRTFVHFTVNGRSITVAVDPAWTLLRVLREELRLTGTKKGCEQGDCGVCTVILEGKAVNACLVLALDARGKKIRTIEGLEENGKLHPLQKAFMEHGATQCGFCTPGMIITAKAFLDENPKPTKQEIRRAISGNLCRCTGYAKIVEAVQAVSEEGGRR